MTTLVVEEGCKGTPQDTTIYREALHNNIHYNNEVEGLVISFTWWKLTCLSFFEILRVVKVMVIVVVAGREVRGTLFEHITIFYDKSTTSVQSCMVDTIVVELYYSIW